MTAELETAHLLALVIVRMPNEDQRRAPAVGNGIYWTKAVFPTQI